MNKILSSLLGAFFSRFHTAHTGCHVCTFALVTTRSNSEFKLAVLAGSSTPDSTDLRQRPADYFFRDVTEYRGLDSYLYSLVC
jgi:hypothetical protein